MSSSSARTRSAGLGILAAISFLAVPLVSMISAPPQVGLAANLVPNPGFEQGTTTPDNWQDAGGQEAGGPVSTIARDTNLKHTGEASLASTGFRVAGARSDTFVVVGGMSYQLSGWYNIGSDSATVNVTISANFADSTCVTTNEGSIDVATSAPIADNSWHQLSITGTAPPGAACGQLQVDMLNFSGNTFSGNFDDIVLDVAPNTPTPTATPTSTSTATPTVTNTPTAMMHRDRCNDHQGNADLPGIADTQPDDRTDRSRDCHRGGHRQAATPTPTALALTNRVAGIALLR